MELVGSEKKDRLGSTDVANDDVDKMKVWSTPRKGQGEGDYAQWNVWGEEKSRWNAAVRSRGKMRF